MGSFLHHPIDVARAMIERVGHRSEHEWREAFCQEVGRALQEREDERAAAYRERNQLVAALSHIFPSHLAAHPPEDTTWDREWMTIVCVHIEEAIPLQETGLLELTERTLTWHIHDAEASLFSHLTWADNDWDGSDTVTKYERLGRLRRHVIVPSMAIAP